MKRSGATILAAVFAACARRDISGGETLRLPDVPERFRDWGFKLVKIDFLSYDISRLWPCDAHPFPEQFIHDDRAWRDDSRTTAEVAICK